MVRRITLASLAILMLMETGCCALRERRMSRRAERGAPVLAPAATYAEPSYGVPVGTASFASPGCGCSGTTGFPVSSLTQPQNIVIPSGPSYQGPPVPLPGVPVIPGGDKMPPLTHNPPSLFPAGLVK